MIEIAVAMGANRNSADEELHKSLNLEIEISKITTPPEEMRDMSKMYNAMSISEVETKYPFIPWGEYMQKIMGKDVPLGPDETVIVTSPEYFTALESIFNSVDRRTLVNYIMWKQMGRMVEYLPKEFRNIQLNFMRKITGSTVMKPRWDTCVSWTRSMLPIAIGSMYVRKHFNADSKSKSDAMVVLLREEMYKIINNADWMDNTTRSTALDKAKAMTSLIGYPLELWNDSKLEEFYSDLKVNDSSVLDAVIHVNNFTWNFKLKEFRKPVDKKDWKLYANVAMANAFYNSLVNSIYFPAGFLQDPVFYADRPNYMNFGAIGSIIGHEITHGFDDVGKQFDKDGKMVNWWDPLTEEKYLEKSKCILEQYSKYYVEQAKRNVNAILTLGENIADNGGIKEAYNAYQSWVRNNSEEPRLPGLEQYSPNQMFWISFGSTWCSMHRNESMSMIVQRDTHAPTEFRIIGSVSNSKDFAKDFQCPVGSRMNPEAKCEVW
ncbi:hypothetical protein WDU94_008377 [Cyamophila willieti]